MTRFFTMVVAFATAFTGVARAEFPPDPLPIYSTQPDATQYLMQCPGKEPSSYEPNPYVDFNCNFIPWDDEPLVDTQDPECAKNLDPEGNVFAIWETDSNAGQTAAAASGEARNAKR